MESLSTALTREHRTIDAGIETFVAGLDGGVVDPRPLLTAVEALRRHIYLEEVFLFPPIREAGLVMPVLVMLREHGALWRLMDTLTEILDGTAPVPTDDQHDDPADDRLLPLCRELLAQLEQHNSKEEPVIYPHADSDLTDDAAAALAAFLRAGSLPSEWTCEAVR